MKKKKEDNNIMRTLKIKHGSLIPSFLPLKDAMGCKYKTFLLKFSELTTRFFSAQPQSCLTF